jgi:prepilin-type N-terminal cleavage/methylation domain-containing protein
MVRHPFKRKTKSSGLLAPHEPVPVDERSGALSSGTDSGVRQEVNEEVNKEVNKEVRKEVGLALRKADREADRKADRRADKNPARKADKNGEKKSDRKSHVKIFVEGFSLIEVAVVLALVSLLIWLAMPRYSAQQSQGYATAMQLELLACAQTLHGLELTASPSVENPWLTLADGDGDGAGDQASGSLANNVCPLSPSTKRVYHVQVQGSEMGFVLGARPLLSNSEANSDADSDAVWTVDHLGRQSWHSEGLAGSGQ